VKKKKKTKETQCGHGRQENDSEAQLLVRVKKKCSGAHYASYTTLQIVAKFFEMLGLSFAMFMLLGNAKWWPF
jgi:hypothetical protein